MIPKGTRWRYDRRAARPCGRLMGFCCAVPAGCCLVGAAVLALSTILTLLGLLGHLGH